MRLAEAALPTSGVAGAPPAETTRAIKTATLMVKMTVNSLRYVEKKVSSADQDRIFGNTFYWTLTLKESAKLVPSFLGKDNRLSHFFANTAF
jgi:hypothetical protein